MKTTESLVRIVLRWYAHRQAWLPQGAVRGPYSSGTSSPAVTDAGAAARKALEAAHDGQLFAAACDAWGLSVAEVGRAAGLGDVEISMFASGRAGISQPDADRLVAQLECIIAKRSPQ